MTHQGVPLAFPTQTHGKSKKRSFPSEQRFRQYDQWARVTGNFVGPGTYNDHLATYQIKQIPCAAIMKPNAALGEESGRLCYIMIGDNIMYDPDAENTEMKNVIRRMRVDDSMSNVSALIALGGRESISKLTKSKN